MQCKYYQILLGQTCEWSLWRGGRFIEVVFKTGSTVFSSSCLFSSSCELRANIFISNCDVY